MSDETTSEQLAEIEDQATEYTPPDGWRVLEVGEKLQLGDMIVRSDGSRYSTERVGYFVGANQRYIRRIGPQPQPEREPQPQPVQVREGRWRTRGGGIRNVTPTPEHDGRAFQYPWWDAQSKQAWTAGGQYYHVGSCGLDLVEYLGPIEPEPQPQPQWEPQAQPQVAAIEELRSEVNYVQRLLGESRQRVTQLEELVADLRTINEATEKTVRAAGQQNTDLQHRLEVVSAEWAEQAGTINGLRAHVEAVKAEVVQERLERNRWHNQVLRLTAELDNKTTECRNLQIELDALQQAPQAETVATAPTSKDDRFEEGWDAGTSQAVETVLEWLEPIRHLIDAADNMAETERASNLAADIIRALPAIMRSLTGLTPED